MVVYFVLYAFLKIVFNIVNIFCGIKMVTFVQSHADFNPRMKELNRQLTNNLIILVWIILDFSLNIFFIPTKAIFPLFFYCWSIIYALFYFIENAGLVSLQVQFFYCMSAPWISVINPIVSIWINRPYRDAVAVKKLVHSLFKKNPMTIHPLQA
jgi:hypothetical protein